MLRNPAVAGQFYAGDATGLRKQVAQYLVSGRPPKDVIGIMVPHAGLVYSGAVAGAVYSTISFPQTFIMLGPNHTGLGSPVSIMDDGEWRLPLGSLKIDRRLASNILRRSTIVERDTSAHMFEHSLEVQLPFIFHISQDVKIVPLSIMQATYEQCQMLAEDIVEAARNVGHKIVILASSDMSHYLPEKTARRKDEKALDRIAALDPEGLFETVHRERISMCGVLPATVMLIASRIIGASSAELIKYMTSGDGNGDYDSVVGYAGVIVY